MKNVDVRRLWKPLAGIAAVLAPAWIVVAQAPSAINGCVGPGGSLKIVSGGSACKQNEQPISWNVQGPAGVAGPTGATGATGPIGPSDTFSTLAVSPVLSAAFGSEVTIATLTAPAGSYVKARSRNRTATDAQFPCSGDTNCGGNAQFALQQHRECERR
jgi:hypothetical protein